MQDFQRFAEAIFGRYGENAKAIAVVSVCRRSIKVQLQKLSGGWHLVETDWRVFQETFGGIVRDISEQMFALARFLNLSFDEGKLAAAEARFEAANAVIEPNSNKTTKATRYRRQRAS